MSQCYMGIVPPHFINTDYLPTGVIDHRIILQINPSHVNYYGASHLSSLQLQRGNAEISKRSERPKRKAAGFSRNVN